MICVYSSEYYGTSLEYVNFNKTRLIATNCIYLFIHSDSFVKSLKSEEYLIY